MDSAGWAISRIRDARLSHGRRDCARKHAPVKPGDSVSSVGMAERLGGSDFVVILKGRVELMGFDGQRAAGTDDFRSLSIC